MSQHLSPSLSNLYPESPAIKDKSITQPPKEYFNSAIKVLLGIVLFVAVYLFLLLAAGFMLYYGVIAAIYILSFRANFIVFGVAAGLVALTVMFSWFLVKFIFKTRRNISQHRREIKENEHPQLFAFMRQLARETATPFPKKVFVSPDVNACVFYNSSFLSLFFPVPKNLEIGLGLVNSVNMSEFKAVLAHEFGHFSQGSMKLGSYIYTVNHMLYDLVYEYDTWDKTLEKWKDIGGIFGLFAVVTFKMISGVRYLLGKAYNLINLSYMSLSRLMEYHADLVAVSVAGNAPMKSALRRIEFGAASFELCSNQLHSLAEKGKFTGNIYQHHQAVNAYLCQLNKLQEIGNLPVISDEEIAKHATKTRIQIKDQWASHPSMSEREMNISKHVVEVTLHEGTPWELFTNPEKLQRELTQHLYQVSFPDAIGFKTEEPEKMQELIVSQLEEGKLDIRYNGYYDGRYIEKFDVQRITAESDTFPLAAHLSWKELYSDVVKKKLESFHNNSADLETLRGIISGSIKAGFFEFDNVKYKTTAAKDVFNKLEPEVKRQQEWLLAHDISVFKHYYSLAFKRDKSEAERYVSLFTDYFILQEEMKKYAFLYSQVQGVIYVLFSKHHWTADEEKNLIREVSGLHISFERFLKESEQIVLHIQTGQGETAQSLRNYILSDPAAPLSAAVFNPDQFNTFIEQVSTVHERIAQTLQESLNQLLALQLETVEGVKLEVV